MTKASKSLAVPPGIPIQSLSIAIKEENWAQYCIDEENKKLAELKYQENLRLANLEIEAESRAQEVAIEKSLAIEMRMGIILLTQLKLKKLCLFR